MPPAPKVSNHQPLTLSAGPIAIDRLARTVTVAGKPVHLAPTDYRLLELLALSAPRVLSPQEIGGALWPHRPLLANVRVSIYRLRAALGPVGAQVTSGTTAVGYVLLEEVPA